MDRKIIDLFLGRQEGSSAVDGWGNLVRCPICGFDYTHIEKIESEIDGKTKILKIYMFGECEHTWELIIREHKGNTFIAIEDYV